MQIAGMTKKINIYPQFCQVHAALFDMYMDMFDSKCLPPQCNISSIHNATSPMYTDKV